MKWFARGHELGDAESTARLALYLMEGRGVDEDDPHREPRNLRQLATAARDGGSPLGTYLFAGTFARGIGVRANEGAARTWYRRAAALGHPLAQQWCEEHGVPCPER